MNRSLLELRHLRTLRALDQTGNLTRAADLLHVTQSALSHQLNAIEASYGAPLFARKSSPLVWSTAGQRLLALANLVLPAVDEAERDIARLLEGRAGRIRIAVECHTCFDWLMPAMDRFRQQWPEVELDIVSGFHPDPVGLLHQQQADIALISEALDDAEILNLPLFEYEIVAIMSNDHPLTRRQYLRPLDFAKETLITYPVPETMLDLYRQLLKPAGITPQKRTAELTVAILQLVASKRGIAALPRWAVASYLDKRYVTARPVTSKGLFAELSLAVRRADAGRTYMRGFADTLREVCAVHLPGINVRL